MPTTMIQFVTEWGRRPGVIVVAAIALMISIAACGGASDSEGEAEGVPTPDARYGTVEALKDAAVEAGLECKRWRQTNVVKLAAESGECNKDSVLATFASEGDLQDQLRTYRNLDDLQEKYDLPPSPRLIGPNWIINAPEAPELQPQLGGTVESG